MTPISNVGYEHVPATYLYCQEDQALPLAVQHMMVEKFGGEGFRTESCVSGHSPFLSVKEKVREVLDGIAGLP